MIIREKVRIGDQLVTLETGRVAKQAGGSCIVRAGDTMVLVTVCGNQEAKPGQSFFPLSVDYQEKTYSAGKIPGGFFKREGKLRDAEVLVSRLIDRPCRPLFPEGYLCEVQVVATVMSFDQQNPPDTLAMIGASAALHISQIPWKGPIAGVRVGRVNGEFIANPTFEQIEQSDCELLVAASRDAIVMVEGEADEISEQDMIEALLFAHRSVQSTLDLIDRMRDAVGKPKWKFTEPSLPAAIKDRLGRVIGGKVREACSIADKHARSDRFKAVRKEAVEILAPEFPGQEEVIKAAYDELKYNTMRAQVLDEGRRLDGRDTRTVRPISIELGVLPRVHGSTLFTRGETQAIVAATLGTTRDSQRLDTMRGDVHKHFMLHYNFPPYSVGEVKPMRGPGRREVGHGNLAERALAKMMPTPEEFPYTVRIVSEITESNGSSSMASVCGGALALMDAGVPLKAPVAGVAMGLIKEGEDYAILTDILGDEDALGDMDFKVCGTEKGVTAIQMDIKIDGLTREILDRALRQAREARLHILDKMTRALPTPRPELSQYAPRITQIRVKPDQVRTIIGPGGKMIRAIVDQTGASIDVADDGTVSVSSADSTAVLKALEIIKSLTTEPEIGEVYEGTVKRVEPYGAFIEILPGKDGLCHISDIDFSHVTSVEDFMNLGDKVTVKVTNIDRDGRIRLSRKEALGGAEGQPAAARAPREERPARAPRDERPARPPREERAPREERDERFPRRDDERPKAREERVPAERAPREDRVVAERAPREERVVAERAPREERVVAERAPREERAPVERAPREERVVAERAPREERAPVERAPREERVVAERAPREERVVAERAPREDRFAARDDRPKTREERAPVERAPREDRFVPRDREERAAGGREERAPREDRFVPRDRDERAPVARAERAPREERVVAERAPREERVVAERAPREERVPAREREDRFVPREREDRVAAREPELDERPARGPVERPERAPREDRFAAREREDRFVPREREDRFKPRDEERPSREAARADEPRRDRPARRDLDAPARPRDVADERPARRDFDAPVAPARVRDVADERPARRDFDAPARSRDAADERPAREPRRELDSVARDAERPRSRDERPARVRDVSDERPARVRDVSDERPARVRDVSDERPARVRDVSDERPARVRDVGDERPARVRDVGDERPARVRDVDLERAPRARDDERAPRARDLEPRPRRDDDRPARARDNDAPRDLDAARPRRDERFDERPRGAREELPSDVKLVDRDDRSERERPSRLRARNRERVREAERERERR